jgi:glutamine amidotransferase
MCKRFPDGNEKVPHVGWNHILTRTSSPTRLFAGVEQDEFVYYTHSYYVPANTPPAAAVSPDTQYAAAAVTNYIHTFAAAVEHENVMGVQFHPEKSGAAGLKILQNFLEF